MAIKIMAQVFAMRNIVPKYKFVLLAIADAADEEGHCWPSVRAISEKTSLGRTSVFKSLKWLEEQGLLKRGKRYIGRQQSSNDYWLNVSLIQQGSTHGCTPPVQTPVPPPYTHVVTESSIEPSEEPSTGAASSTSAEGKNPDMKDFGKTDVEEALKSPLSDPNLDPDTILQSAEKSGSRYTVAVIRKVWGELYNYYGYGFFAEWTLKQKGQINQIQKKLGEMDVIEVVGLVLRDWHKFTAQTDAYKIPKRPDVGFLLKHIGTAGNMLLKESLQSIAKPVKGLFDPPKT